MAEKQTQDSDQLLQFAPKFAELYSDARTAHSNSMFFPIGSPNDAFARYFIGQSYLAPVSSQQAGIFNVTFERSTL